MLPKWLQRASQWSMRALPSSPRPGSPRGFLGAGQFRSPRFWVIQGSGQGRPLRVYAGPV
eukprot:1633083-Pyramimonas_sp.AAC.1